ncbi:hypothetical protein GpartN1_g4465.t1 [Galdieria partita]|uniref:General transcription factor TFIIB n=1 Tax=Galdieria partita TaxID=83374 RepID=A0A9C7PY21_9RHOD|nr:hypothetical protein GpartN1_g4465.t1 [Galdieria partita]
MNAISTNSLSSSLAPQLNADVPDTCKECGSDDLVEDHAQGDVICRNCGLVAAERIVDLGSEWRNFENDDSGTDPSRVGGPNNPLLESGPSTVIGGGAVSDSRSLNARLNRAQNRHSTSKSDRVLLDAFSLISQYAERSYLSQRVIDRAQELFKLYFDHLTLNPQGGRTRYLKEHETVSVVAASLHWASQIEGVPRTFKEMSSLTQVPKKTLSDTYLKMKQSLKLNQLNKSTEDFIGRFCSYLRLPHFFISKALQVVQVCRDVDGVYGRSYVTKAAAAIYTACEKFGDEELKRMVRLQLPKVSGVEIVTIVNTFKIMKPYSDKILASQENNVHSK